jgi:hypothetical protein
LAASDNAVEQLDDLEVVVAAGVVDQWQPQTSRGGDTDRLDDLRHHVARGHEVDVVAAALLQGQHGIGQLAMRRALTVTPVVDLPVLAEAAQQVAVGEEDGAGATAADQLPLLAVVGAGGVDLDPGRCRADSRVAGEAVGAAAARADLTARQDLPQRVLAFCQLARPLELQITGLELGICICGEWYGLSKPSAPATRGHQHRARRGHRPPHELPS